MQHPLEGITLSLRVHAPVLLVILQGRQEDGASR